MYAYFLIEYVRQEWSAQHAPFENSQPAFSARSTAYWASGVNRGNKPLEPP